MRVMWRRALLTLLSGLALGGLTAIAAACDGSDEAPDPTGTSRPTVTASPSPTTTSTTPPAGTSTPTPSATPIEVTHALWLVDAATAEVTVLLESPHPFGGEHFEGDTVTVFASGAHRFALDGTELPAPDPVCRGTPEGSEVGGRSYEGIQCGEVSPDGRYVAYQTYPGLASDDLTYEYGFIDLATGEQHVVRDDLQHCGGCDSAHASLWSPSGRYYLLAEIGQERRFFIADPATGGDRPLGYSGNSWSAEWAPNEDVVALSSEVGTRLVDAAGGHEAEYELPRPAIWDPSGAYLFAPSRSEAPATRVLDVARGEVHDLPGQTPSTHGWGNGRAVAGVPGGGFTAALASPPNCDGVQVTSPLAPPRCIEGSRAAAVSPGGTRVAITRQAGEVVAGREATRPSANYVPYELVILDVATGVTVVAPEPLLGYAPGLGIMGFPPEITWNDAGTHLLVRWPSSFGV